MLGEVCGLWYLRPLRTDTPTHRGQAERPWRPSQGMGIGWAATTQKAPGKTPGTKSQSTHFGASQGQAKYAPLSHAHRMAPR